jgi:DNA-binding GntR family transcriptional regulator
MTETYGINRGTAAKALRVLAGEGLVTVVKGRGWFVTPRR